MFSVSLQSLAYDGFQAQVAPCNDSNRKGTLAGTYGRCVLWFVVFALTILCVAMLADESTDVPEDQALSPGELKQIFALLDECKRERKSLFDLELNQEREKYCSHLGVIQKSVWQHGFTQGCHIELDASVPPDYSGAKRCLSITQFFVKTRSRVQVGGAGYSSLYLFSPAIGRIGEYERLVASEANVFSLTRGDYYAVVVYPEGGSSGRKRWGLGIQVEPENPPEPEVDEKGNEDTPGSDGW